MAACGGAWQVTDSDVVELYCSLLDRRAGFRAVIAREGWLSRGSKGQQVLHPVARLLSDVEARLVPLEDRLGLNPESRLRLGLSQANVRNELDQFMIDELGR